MFDRYLSKFVTTFFVFGLASLILGIPIIIYFLLTEMPIIGWASLIIFCFVVSYYTFKELFDEEIKTRKIETDRISSEVNRAAAKAEQDLKVAAHKEEMWRRLLKERTSGFPTLFTSIEYYESLLDDRLSGYLQNKSHPAVTAAENVRIESKRRREAEFILRKTQAVIEYYENIAPFLLDFKEQEIDESEDALKDYTEEEIKDPVTQYLAKEEYRKLPSVERNQKALDRFWSRPKSKWLLGRIYERYVGYLYEEKGYSVDYTGIFKGYEDLGRDLICSKGNQIIVIQCKNWSQFKTIFEKHIFQFFGTVFQYRDQNPRKKVRAIFYTTTELSELARRFAKELNIELQEKFKMSKEYPCIKCNISIDGSKIYHLPFDQQYDKTKIEVRKGEFYCLTVAEAEGKGFRRAFRWKGVREI